jgi:hypothetical protein
VCGDRHVIVTLTVIEGKAYLSGLLATVTMMTLVTLIYGLILDRGASLLRRLSYPVNLTRRTRRTEQAAPLALYSRPYFSLLARVRWGRVEAEALIEHRARSSKGEGRSEPPPRV